VTSLALAGTLRAKAAGRCLPLLEFENFRCFGNHKLTLRPLTIIVGRNNAGKSTVAEGLRLISLVLSRYWTSHYGKIPRWLDIPSNRRGIAPSLRGYEFNFETVFHRYGEPPASVSARFEDGTTVTAYVGPRDEVYGVVLDKRDRPLAKARAGAPSSLKLSILPQIGPLLREEELLDEDYVQRSRSSALASLHFRNELWYQDEAFDAFSELAGQTWPGLKTHPPERTRREGRQYVSLMIRDRDFAAEAAWMGHGLQMWLQVMWFLARADTESSVALDEPDVYMHADLQRKLIRLVERRFAQTIIATHSVEIISEVEPENILIVERRRRTSTYANSLPGVQDVIDRIGGVHNVHLARLASAQRCVLVEGDDMKILRHVYDRLFPDSLEPLDTIPNMPIGGWDGWNYAVGSSMLLRDAVGAPIKVYCILDRDYRSEEVVKERYKSASAAHVDLHVWRRKELENYLLVPTAIARILSREVRGNAQAPTAKEVSSKLEHIVSEFRDTCVDSIAEELVRRKQSKSVTEANPKARSRVTEAYKTHEGGLGIVCGKDVLSRLSSWAQSTYGVSLSAIKLAREIERREIEPELAVVLSAIQANHELPA
jgi:hypothetical protein